MLYTRFQRKVRQENLTDLQRSVTAFSLRAEVEVENVYVDHVEETKDNFNLHFRISMYWDYQQIMSPNAIFQLQLYRWKVDILRTANTLFHMKDGRRPCSGQVIPISTAVTDAKYCFRNHRTNHHASEILMLCAGQEACLPTYHVVRNDLPCSLIEFVYKGKGRINFDGSSIELSAGYIVSYSMDTAHDLRSDPSDPMTKYFAAYQRTEAIEDRSWLAAGEVRWTPYPSVLKALFDELIREGQQSGEVHERITEHYMELILLKGCEALLPKAGRNNAASESYNQVLANIQTNFAEIESLEELGRLSNLEPYYICRLFRRFSQETPTQCLTRHKLNRAAELVLSHSKPINEVAREVGYDDPYYFSRVFKKRFGCSPSEFRSTTPE